MKTGAAPPSAISNFPRYFLGMVADALGVRNWRGLQGRGTSGFGHSARLAGGQPLADCGPLFDVLRKPHRRFRRQDP